MPQGRHQPSPRPPGPGFRPLRSPRAGQGQKTEVCGPGDEEGGAEEAPQPLLGQGASAQGWRAWVPEGGELHAAAGSGGLMPK